MDSMQKSWPSLSCPSSNGTTFWTHEWTKHGTCSLSKLDQHSYFEATLNIRERVKLLQILQNAGIQPGGFYGLDAIKEAIRNGTGHEAGIQCNKDPAGNSQLYQVYICVDKSGSSLVQCPTIPQRKCNSTIEFPSF
ncbi:Ribonuclease T2 family protein [Forsythia ovata]|uniref:Ribonuclease T2 family protein n=1 Tax=Forsythia ovata TaxID=205694 RepID=A0ABD1WAR2_9LAMI